LKKKGRKKKIEGRGKGNGREKNEQGWVYLQILRVPEKRERKERKNPKITNL